MAFIPCTSVFFASTSSRKAVSQRYTARAVSHIRISVSMKTTVPAAQGGTLVLKPLERQEKTSAGLLLSQNVENTENMGVVVSKGVGQALQTGEFLDYGIQVGDVVLYEKFGAESIKVDGVEYKVVRFRDVRAKW